MPSQTLNQKLRLMIAVLWTGLTMISCFGAWQIRSSMIHERREQLRAVVEESISIVKHYYALSHQGGLIEDDAQKQALDMLSVVRYGHDGYVTVNNSNCVLLMYPFSKELVGKDMSGFSDPSGNHLFVDAIKAGNQAGGGFVDYLWPVPGWAKPVRKESYSVRFVPWDWYIVSGMYMDDIQSAFYRNLALWFAVAGLLGIVATGLMMLVLRRVRSTLGGDLESAVAAAQRMARGDLTIVVPARHRTAGSLLQALDSMRAGLVDAMLRLRFSTESVDTGSAEIAAGNADLAQRTERQAAALVQTSASMKQMTESVRRNAESAGDAARLAEGALGAAVLGSRAVDDVVSTMRQITDRSGKIGEITNVIDDIASQTNILALNAAVEAARAGEQGRGFAVVAAEVRVLSRRSATAAKEIKVLIDMSAQAIDGGAAIVGNARLAMEDIVRSVRRLNGILETISVASLEQSAGIEQVNRAIVDMDQVSEQNAALVGQLAATALSLNDQVAALHEAISEFILPA